MGEKYYLAQVKSGPEDWSDTNLRSMDALELFKYCLSAITPEIQFRIVYREIEIKDTIIQLFEGKAETVKNYKLEIF